MSVLIPLTSTRMLRSMRLGCVRFVVRLWIAILIVLAPTASVLPEVGAPVAPAGVALAQGTGVGQVNVEGQWNGSIQVTSGPGAGLSDTCNFTMAQDGTSITGFGSCTTFGSGNCSGTLTGGTFQLTCSNPFFGTLGVTASITTDGTHASGTFSASNGSGGTYIATRQVLATDVVGGSDENPNAPFGLDPINLATGNFAHQRTDLLISGRGLPLQFARAYNSLDPTVGPFGVGWTHSYNVRLLFDTTIASLPKVIVVNAGGRRDTYLQNPSGSYAPPPGVFAVLVRNADGTFTLTRQTQVRLTFAATGRLTRITDRYGNHSDLAYDANGRLQTITDAAGRGVLTLAYDTCSASRLCSVTDWTGRAVQFGYDASGRLSNVWDRQNPPPSSPLMSLGYDGTSSRLTTITDARGHLAVQNVYDSAGRVAEQHDAVGSVTCIYYGTAPTYTSAACLGVSPAPSSGQTVQVDALANKTTFSYDSASRSTRVQDAVGGITAFAYDTENNRTSTTDPKGNTTSFCYDVDYTGASVSGSRGNLTRTISPPPTVGANPLVTLIKYDSKNNVVETIAPKGVNNGVSVTCSTNLSAAISPSGPFVTDLSYDATLGTELLSVTRKYTDPDLGPQTATTKFEYGDITNPGLVTTLTPPRGNTGPSPDHSFATTLAYGTLGSQAGMLLSVTDPLGDKTTYGYDAVGRRTSLVDPNGNASGATAADHTWSFVYDNEDRLTQATAPAPAHGGATLTTSASFDAVGNRLMLTDADGQITRYQYDARDSLQQVLQSDNNLDPSASGANKIATLYSYDALGNLVRVDRDGIGSTDTTKEEIVDYAYDGLNRVRKETQYPQGGWPASPNGSTSSQTLLTQTTYDPNSNRLTLTDPLAQVSTFGYDPVNRLTGITYTNAAPGTTSTANVSYGYDANSNRSSMQDGTGTTSYSYDELDRLRTVTSPGPQAVSYRYDVDGNRTKVIYPDATAVAYTFDKASRLQSLLDWANHTTSYSYFADGLLTTVTNVNQTTAQFSYDNARRLSQVWNQASTGTISRHTYTLDAVGNRTQLSEVLPQLGVPGPIGLSGEPTVAGPASGDSDDLTAAAISSAPLAQIAPLDTSSVTLANPGPLFPGIDPRAPGRGRTLGWTIQRAPGLFPPSLLRHKASPTPGGITPGADTNMTSADDAAAVDAGDDPAAVDAAPAPPLGVVQPSLADGPDAAEDGAPVQEVVSAGSARLAAALPTDNLYAWGDDYSGQLGDGQPTNRSTPQPVLGSGGTGTLSGVTATAAGAYHSLALKNDGSVWAWGGNFIGQLGDGTSAPSRYAPVQVVGPGGSGTLGDVSAIGAGLAFSVALKSDGSVWTWGYNLHGD